MGGVSSDRETLQTSRPTGIDVEPEPVSAGVPAAAPERIDEVLERAGRSRRESPSMLPLRRRRSAVESFFVRLVATCGVVAIGVAIAAIMVSKHSQGWVIGLVVSGVSVALAAVLWSTRRL